MYKSVQPFKKNKNFTAYIGHRLIAKFSYLKKAKVLSLNLPLYFR